MCGTGLIGLRDINRSGINSRMGGAGAATPHSFLTNQSLDPFAVAKAFFFFFITCLLSLSPLAPFCLLPRLSSLPSPHPLRSSGSRSFAPSSARAFPLNFTSPPEIPPRPFYDIPLPSKRRGCDLRESTSRRNQTRSRFCCLGYPTRPTHPSHPTPDPPDTPKQKENRNHVWIPWQPQEAD